MNPEERLQKARKLVEAYKALDLSDDDDGFDIVRLFVAAIFPRYTVRETNS